MKKITIYSILSLIFVSSCATTSVPMDEVKQDLTAKQFQAPSEKSRIYIYREHAYGGSAVKTPITLNNKLIGESVVSTYFALDITPGQYEIGCLGHTNSEVTIKLKKGEIAYVENQLNMGFTGPPGCEVKEVTADVAQPAILKTKRARTNF